MQLPNNWNKTIQERGGHVLQSVEWASFQASVGRQPYYGIGDDWFWLAYNRQVTGLHYLLAVHNPNVTADLTTAIDSLKIKASDLHCDFIRVEPVGNVTHQQMLDLGAKKIADVQPSSTLVLDLSKSEEELRSGLESGHRNRINTAQKRGVTVAQSASLNTVGPFLKLLKDTASHAKITNHPDWYYQKMAKSLIEQGIAKFYIASAEGSPASISLIIDWGETRYYAHTGNDQILNRQYKAAVSNVWQMILDAKADGLKYFDFWGIAPPDQPDHSWAGLTGFKKGFGGEVVTNIGTYDIAINKAKYQLYTTYKKMRGRA
jgi:lipid II:glycine glycyltransferase (peptidoglycan interpeptide bridge formation enzyme)